MQNLWQNRFAFVF